MKETFRSFLEELKENDNDGSAGRELLEKEVLETMRQEGFSDEQIYEMPLVRFLDLFYDAYLQRANSILSKADPEDFLKGITSELGKG
jgi:hypothetical protein